MGGFTKKDRTKDPILKIGAVGIISFVLFAFPFKFHALQNSLLPTKEYLEKQFELPRKEARSILFSTHQILSLYNKHYIVAANKEIENAVVVLLTYGVIKEEMDFFFNKLPVDISLKIIKLGISLYATAQSGGISQIITETIKEESFSLGINLLEEWEKNYIRFRGGILSITYPVRGSKERKYKANLEYLVFTQPTGRKGIYEVKVIFISDKPIPSIEGTPKLFNTYGAHFYDKPAIKPFIFIIEGKMKEEKGKLKWQNVNEVKVKTIFGPGIKKIGFKKRYDEKAFTDYLPSSMRLSIKLLKGASKILPLKKVSIKPNIDIKRMGRNVYNSIKGVYQEIIDSLYQVKNRLPLSSSVATPESPLIEKTSQEKTPQKSKKENSSIGVPSLPINPIHTQRTKNKEDLSSTSNVNQENKKLSPLPGKPPKLSLKKSDNFKSDRSPAKKDTFDFESGKKRDKSSSLSRGIENNPKRKRRNSTQEKTEGISSLLQEFPPCPIPERPEQEVVSTKTVIISEVAWAGTVRNYADEWIELKNLLLYPVSLKGWRLQDKKGDIFVLFEDKDKIDPGGFFLLERSDDNTLPTITADKIYKGSLSNKDEALYLFSPSCVLQDYVVTTSKGWPGGDNERNIKRSMERGVDLVWHSYYPSDPSIFNPFPVYGTPKAENSKPLPTSFLAEQPPPPKRKPPPPVFNPLDVVISEVAWAGTEASYTDEWIELYNNTSRSIDLTGWKIKTGDGSIDFELSGIIPPRSYFLLERTNDDTISNLKADLIYKGSLSNKGEDVYLLDPKGKVIDMLPFSGGWPAGSNNPERRSAERIKLNKPGTDPNNWATFPQFASEKYLDAKNNPVLGTPKAPNLSSFTSLPTSSLATFYEPSLHYKELNFSSLPSQVSELSLSVFPPLIPVSTLEIGDKFLAINSFISGNWQGKNISIYEKTNFTTSDPLFFSFSQKYLTYPLYLTQSLLAFYSAYGPENHLVFYDLQEHKEKSFTFSPVATQVLPHPYSFTGPASVIDSNLYLAAFCSDFSDKMPILMAIDSSQNILWATNLETKTSLPSFPISLENLSCSKNPVDFRGKGVTSPQPLLADANILLTVAGRELFFLRKDNGEIVASWDISSFLPSNFYGSEMFYILNQQIQKGENIIYLASSTHLLILSFPQGINNPPQTSLLSFSPHMSPHYIYPTPSLVYVFFPSALLTFDPTDPQSTLTFHSFPSFVFLTPPMKLNSDHLLLSLSDIATSKIIALSLQDQKITEIYSIPKNLGLPSLCFTLNPETFICSFEEKVIKLER